jgi:SMI1 / KNR4 family (SUKH-1)
MDWPSVFDETIPEPGATEAELHHFVVTVGQLLSAAEVAEVNRSQTNPFPKGDPLHGAYRPFDPSHWILPNRPLPPDYLEFLRWSNGGWCRSGDREFGFFPTAEVRGMILAYHLPQYMPLALPFAFNGAGTFYLFDMREEAVAGEYPIVCAHTGNLGWGPDECYLVARSFVGACRGKENVDELRWGTA